VSVFSLKHDAAAIGRLPEMSNNDIRELRKRAQGPGSRTPALDAYAEVERVGLLGPNTVAE
jgi:hypothetical protein